MFTCRTEPGAAEVLCSDGHSQGHVYCTSVDLPFFARWVEHNWKPTPSFTPMPDDSRLSISQCDCSLVSQQHLVHLHCLLWRRISVKPPGPFMPVEPFPEFSHLCWTSGTLVFILWNFGFHPPGNQSNFRSLLLENS